MQSNLLSERDELPTTVRPLSLGQVCPDWPPSLSPAAPAPSAFVAPLGALLADIRSSSRLAFSELERFAQHESVSNLLPGAVAAGAILAAIMAGAFGAVLMR